MKQSSYPLIGLTGYKGVGKDTAAQYLVDYYGFERRAFADKLKAAVANLFGIPVEEVDKMKSDDFAVVELHPANGLVPERYTWREFLQRFGTEMGRNTFGRDFWVNLTLGKPFSNPVVYTDVRFPNEAVALKNYGGTIINVERPGYESDGHASEQDLSAYTDYKLLNDSSKADLFLEVEDVMDDAFGMELPDDS